MPLPNTRLFARFIPILLVSAACVATSPAAAARSLAPRAPAPSGFEPAASLEGNYLAAYIAGALRDSVRQTDETFRLEDDQLCVLAPNHTTADGTRMAERLAAALAEFEATGGLRITISAGVVSCPEHGDDADRLLRQADTAMWRARATGRPVTVGGLQDR